MVRGRSRPWKVYRDESRLGAPSELGTMGRLLRSSREVGFRQTKSRGDDVTVTCYSLPP